MKPESSYDQWKRRRRQIDAPEDFAADVMQRIQAFDAAEPDDGSAVWPMLHGRLIGWWAAGGLVALGLFRLLYVTANFFRPGLLAY